MTTKPEPKPADPTNADPIRPILIGVLAKAKLSPRLSATDRDPGPVPRWWPRVADALLARFELLEKATVKCRRCGVMHLQSESREVEYGWPLCGSCHDAYERFKTGA